MVPKQRQKYVICGSDQYAQDFNVFLAILCNFDIVISRTRQALLGLTLSAFVRHLQSGDTPFVSPKSTCLSELSFRLTYAANRETNHC
jgi:hypothetical protein